jgi:hypothetical protein
MSYSAPLELLTDATGSVTFGWMEEGVYYARFSHCLSARLGEAFVARLRAAIQSTRGPIRYFGDGRALESDDLLARNAFVRAVTEHRRRFESITLLAWSGGEIDRTLLSVLGEPIEVTKDTIDFEASLFSRAPRARYKLGAKTDNRSRSRWPLRR